MEVSEAAVSEPSDFSLSSIHLQLCKLLNFCIIHLLEIKKPAFVFLFDIY